MTTPMLSVLVPTYNASEYIGRAIQSTNNLGLPPDLFEIVVQDNCSEYGADEILNDLSAEFPNIKLFKNDENVGRVENWNRCISSARGRYIVFLFPTETFSLGCNIKLLLNEMSRRNIRMARGRIVNRTKCADAPLLKDRARVEEKFIGEELRRSLKKFGAIPFGMLQTYVFERNLISAVNARFNADYPLVADQDFVVQVGFLNGRRGEVGFLDSENINIIFDDTVLTRTHNQSNDFKNVMEEIAWLSGRFQAITLLDFYSRFSGQYLQRATADLCFGRMSFSQWCMVFDKLKKASGKNSLSFVLNAMFSIKSAYYIVGRRVKLAWVTFRSLRHKATLCI